MGLLFVSLLLLFLLVSTDALGTVAELDDSSFDPAIARSRYILVDFYAPWCGHCKVLAPELDRVAADFPDPGVVFAKVNADRFRGIASKYKIEAYPTLKLFVDGVPTDYTGSLKADLMLPILKRMISPDMAYVHNESALAQFLSHAGSDLPVFIAFLNGEEDLRINELAKEYKLRAWFAAIPADALSQQNLLTSYGVTAPPALLVHRDDGHVFYGSVAKENMTAFVKRNLLPPVTRLTRDNLNFVKADGRSILLCICDKDTASTDSIRRLNTLAQAHTDFLFASLDASVWPDLAVMFHYEKISKLVIWTGGSDYYMIEDEFSLQEEDLAGHTVKLLEEFREGKAKKHLIKGPSFREQLMGFIGQNLVYFFLFLVSVAMFLQSMDWKSAAHE